jgi:NADH-quinone oxidoreductase subunit H
VPPGPFGLDPVLWAILRGLIAVLLVIGLLMNGALLQVYLERKLQAIAQDRLGPLHVGPFGLLQTFADAIKLLTKEDVRARFTDAAFFLAAPSLVFMPLFAAYVVLPFAPGWQVADLNIGLLYLATLGSMEVLGIVIAGWASNNKYSLMGGLRSAGQLISYEVPSILSLVTVVLVTGTLSMAETTRSQEGLLGLNLLVLPAAFLTYFVAALAETNRNPFDLPEAESELVAGFLTEYSGMRWAIFFLAEYGSVTLVCAIMTTLWLGGWNGPLVDAFAPIGIIWFTVKTYLLVLVFMWIRATLPRLRIDQLMNFCWKVLIPLTLLNLFATATVVVSGDQAGLPPAATRFGVAVVNWLLVIGFILFIPKLQERRLRSIRERLARERALAGSAPS